MILIPMAADNFNAVQMTDLNVNRLIQQLLDQIVALDTVTETLAGVLATDDYKKSPNDHEESTSLSVEKLEQILAVTQQMVENHQYLLRQSSQQLQQRIRQTDILYTIANQYGETTGTERVLLTALDAVWHKMSLQFAVVILGETELGPFYYQSMRGITDAWQYINNICPFPLWGVLARALLPRLNPDEADFLVIKDIARENLPLVEEFPWLPRKGSLMILPLRADKRTQGAILLGSQAVNAFDDETLCTDYLAIAHQTARVLQLAQMHHELNERSGQLLSLQLFTKSIATAHNYDKLVDVLVEGIFEAMGRVSVSIIFNDQLWHRTIDGSTVIPPQSLRIIDWAMQAGQPIFYDPDDSEGSLERFYYNESGHALVVPILRNERTQGAIQITTNSANRRFEEGDMIVLRTIANCAAIILRDIEE